MHIEFDKKELGWRLMKFMSELTPEQRKKSVLCVEEPKMCKDGKKLFLQFCDDTSDGGFLSHFGGDAKTNPGCQQCAEAFIQHLEIVAV